MNFEELPWIEYITTIIDILVVWYVVYKLIMLIRGTKAVQLIKGIVVIFGVWFISSYFGLRTLEWLMGEAVTWGFLAVIIIFQPELRRALEQLGRGRFFSRTSSNEEEAQQEAIEALGKAIQYMAKRRIGALISIERETGLNDYIETGITMNAQLTSELLINLFIPNTPLHDGAVIIRQQEIMAAACYLPLSESPFITKELGTRHRAALGISEVTDCLTIVVSEETGQVSLTKNGELHRDLTIDALKEKLTEETMMQQKASTTSKWQWRGRKNG
ncbi:TIGR00159 family protein [Bacillaceae bacterium SIJ1]|uniref:diadenylate cyclase CdaA n=1 Tax=Litoribacterium kuwaitense TaxID=1398745 RepID=UPI0013ECCB75|nr:diadenylate cyclase CdaA [Litoribacterium kuwaitense]NGP45682.1 TIGR00159 family protein [Litoribacterium kuwaitense]